MSKPEGFSTLTTAIITENAQSLIDSYEKALGAELGCAMNCPLSGKIAHASLKIGESSLFISDANPDMGMNSTGRNQFYVYVDDVAASYKRAEDAGFSGQEAPEDTFWGDRVGTLTDSIGNTCKLAQHVKDVTPEEMEAAMKEMAAACYV